MKKPKILFHGSSHKIRNYLKPRKPADRTFKYNSQNGVYATDRFGCAIGISLAGKQRVFVKNYISRNFKIIFIEKPPIKVKRFIYEVSSEGFKESPKGSHQWFSKARVKILKTHIYSTEQLRKYWRMATKEEKKRYGN